MKNKTQNKKMSKKKPWIKLNDLFVQSKNTHSKDCWNENGTFDLMKWHSTVETCIEYILKIPKISLTEMKCC